MPLDRPQLVASVEFFPLASVALATAAIVVALHLSVAAALVTAVVPVIASAAPTATVVVVSLAVVAAAAASTSSAAQEEKETAQKAIFAEHDCICSHFLASHLPCALSPSRLSLLHTITQIAITHQRPIGSRPLRSLILCLQLL